MQMTLVQVFELGGWTMWPLLFFSVATITIVLERTVRVLLTDLDVARIKKAVVERIDAGDLAGAEEACAAAKKNLLAAPIFLAGLKVVGLGEHRVERAMEAAASKRIKSLEKGFDLLVALGSLSPITGFLGTVSGMIGAFHSIASAKDVNAQLVAGGIYEALITTVYGLCIAIVAIAGYNVFAHIADRFAAGVEESGNEILTSLVKSGALAASEETGVSRIAEDVPVK